MRLNDPDYVDLLLSETGIKVDKKFRLVYMEDGRQYDGNLFHVGNCGDLYDEKGNNRNELFAPILLDVLMVVKLPFKPGSQQKYQSVNDFGDVITTHWWGNTVDYYRFNAKNCFPMDYTITPKDIERILNEMKGAYHND